MADSNEAFEHLLCLLHAHAAGENLSRLLDSERPCQPRCLVHSNFYFAMAEVTKCACRAQREQQMGANNFVFHLYPKPLVDMCEPVTGGLASWFVTKSKLGKHMEKLAEYFKSASVTLRF